jgi:CRISPR system Cascade subunit CasE
MNGQMSDMNSRFTANIRVLQKHAPPAIRPFWHKAAWALFPNMPEAKRKDLGFLFRADEDEAELCLTVASRNKPVRPVWCYEESWLCRSLPPEYLEHKKFRFKLRVNPTRTTRKNPDQTPREKKNGRHEAILKNPELKKWFLDKAEQNGFRVIEKPKEIELDIFPPVFHELGKNGYEGTIVGVDLQGMLEVTDGGLFKKAFEKGIGRARSFGFGLLVIQPIQ